MMAGAGSSLCFFHSTSIRLAGAEKGAAAAAADGLEAWHPWPCSTTRSLILHHGRQIDRQRLHRQSQQIIFPLRTAFHFGALTISVAANKCSTGRSLQAASERCC